MKVVMEAVTPDLVKNLTMDQIHTIAIEQHAVMHSPHYEDAEYRIKDFRGSETERGITEAFNSTGMITVVEDYTIEAIVVAALAQENKDRLSEPELELLTHAWNRGLLAKQSSGNQFRSRR